MTYISQIFLNNLKYLFFYYFNGGIKFMVAWLYFVQSNIEFHDLMVFLLTEEDVSGTNYLVFGENVESIDGRVFHTSRGYLLAVNFLSHASDIEAKLERVGLNSNSLVDLYKIDCKNDNPLTEAITIRESAENFIWEKKLKKFAVSEHFRFSDGSSLTIPQICHKKFII